jgi:putative tryptophan/tyrosine transport system substrate-binding protein
MRRRDFIALIGGAAAAWPVAASAQKPRRIGALMSPYLPTDKEGIASANALADTLQKLGWHDGDNLRIEYRWPGGDPALIKAAAADMVNSAPDLIVVAANAAVAEVHRLTNTIPIVFTRVADPVGSGFATSLARPEGNITGFQASDAGLGGKWVEVLHDADPAVSRLAAIYGSDSKGNEAFLATAQAGARSIAVPLTAIDVSKDLNLDAALASFASQPGGALIVVPHQWITSNRKIIIALAERYRLPAIYGYRLFAADGGLISYGPDDVDQWRGAATYANRILKGEKPSDLPIQAPTKYQMVINLKAAKAIGLSVSPAFASRADEVIE